jgi:DNA-binding transcriptional MerR regulator
MQMMKTVREVSRITGVSVRTLHHYDAIGLLKPTEVTPSGYRLYDKSALRRLQTILLFRELRFPLKDIKKMIDQPGFDQMAALNDQNHLLELQREHLDNLIAFARKLKENGGTNVDFSAFDRSEYNRYAEEAKEKWGGTDAYKEYTSRAEQQTDDAKEGAAEGLMAIFERFGKVKHLKPSSDEAQALVKELQQFITDNFYTCTPKILSGLGQMYTGDERFRKNIDNAGGEGTAEFTAKAIEIYTGK